jgi:thiol-disulfide isomerase/thioredoxin
MVRKRLMVSVSRSWFRGLAAVLLVFAVWGAAGCSVDEAPKPEPSQAAAASPTGAAAAVQAQAPAGRVEWLKAPDEGDTAGIVRRELARAKEDRRTLVIYLGATWCEPCERFHHAAEAGELDAALPGLRFLEFDLDRDRERLERAGYASKMIPLFALPKEDGTDAGLRMEGGMKGEGAAKELTDRLLRLLAKGARGARQG